MIPAWLVLVAFVVRDAWLWSCVVWLFSESLFHRDPPRVAVWLASELRPLYWPAALLLVVHWFSDGGGFWDYLGAACTVLNWYLLKDKHDDRWKRRRVKVAEVIARRGSRLVVVPESGGAS